MKNRNDNEEIRWKRKFDKLKYAIENLNDELNLDRFEQSNEPFCVASDLIYVSFDYEIVTTTEKIAIKHFGENNYDIYRLWKKSPKRGDNDE